MKNQNDDSPVMAHIKKLTEREQHLYGKTDLTDDDVKELHKIKSELDQYWDLLHQRQGFRDAGKDPNKAELRDQGTIENYKE
jgi:hypothetical protein